MFLINFVLFYLVSLWDFSQLIYKSNNPFQKIGSWLYYIQLPNYNKLPNKMYFIYIYIHLSSIEPFNLQMVNLFSHVFVIVIQAIYGALNLFLIYNKMNYCALCVQNQNFFYNFWIYIYRIIELLPLFFISNLNPSHFFRKRKE